MTTDIQTAARALMEAAGRQRLERLRDIAQRRMLCRAKIQEANESRERLARLDAEYARVEAQTAADIAREAMQAAQGAVILYPQPPGEVIEAPLTQPQPELYRAGLPPERLRKVWAEWEEKDSGLVDFRGNEYRGTMGDGSRDWRWRPMAELGGFADVKLWAFRPHSATWARVEAMADAAEKPTLLDLTKLPPGTVCEATKFFGIYNSGIMLNAGDRFCVVAQADGDLPVLIEVGGKDWWLSALVPARVVKEGGEQ